MLKKTALLMVLIVLLVVAASLTAAGEEVNEATFVSKDSLSLTVYDQGITLVQDVRTFTLTEGLNKVAFEGISPQVDFTSVIFASSVDQTSVVQQNYTIAESFSLPNILAKNIGEVVSLTTREGVAYEGTLINVGGDVTLQQADGTFVILTFGEIQQYRVANLPPKELAQPTLTLIVNSPTAGDQQLTLTYAVTGLSWTTNYNLLLADDNKSLKMTGWLSLFNGSGVTYENAQMTLSAGEFDRLQFVSRDTGLGFSATATALPTATPTPFDGGGGLPGFVPPPPSENFLYALPQPVTLPADETLQLQFLSGADTAASNVYVFDASPRVYGYGGFITDPGYGLTSTTTVLNYLSFSTGEDGLASPLPAGAMNIYASDETLLQIGATYLNYTPAGETVQIFLESSADVSGERRQIAFQSLSSDALQETFELRLRNRTEDDIEVVVPERMTRSASWEVLGSTMPYEQPDAFGIEFTAAVPAGEEVTFNYTVLYTRPQQ